MAMATIGIAPAKNAAHSLSRARVKSRKISNLEPPALAILAAASGKLESVAPAWGALLRWRLPTHREAPRARGCLWRLRHNTVGPAFYRRVCRTIRCVAPRTRATAAAAAARRLVEPLPHAGAARGRRMGS